MTRAALLLFAALLSGCVGVQLPTADALRSGEAKH